MRTTIDGSALPAQEGDLVDVDNDNQPEGVGVLDFNTLSLSMISGTSVCWRVFASELASTGNTFVNTTLKDVTIKVDGRENELRAQTDKDGNFYLDPSQVG